VLRAEEKSATARGISGSDHHKPTCQLQEVQISNAASQWFKMKNRKTASIRPDDEERQPV
jgi:hypothetical protein